MDFESGEVLLVNKPLGWTSFDVVNKLRYSITKRLGKRIKVGHAGTLDPLATGLLIICTGKMTRRVAELSGLDKEYTGTFFIGATTPTYDGEMEPDAIYPITHIDDISLPAIAKKFTGSFEQVPPVFSAIKVAGVAAYHNARKGKEVEMKKRQVTINEFELTRIAMPEVDFRVSCSKGTYLRSLAYDYGKALNSGAYLLALCRTRIGEFNLKDAWDLGELVKSIEA